MILSLLIDQQYGFAVEMLRWVWSIKKSLSKRFSKETLTSFTFIFYISLLNKVAIDRTDV
jgi:hypothetical protein